MGPEWARAGLRQLRGGKATVRVQDIQTGQRRLLADFKGTNSAPAWSPDGQQLALSLSREGGTQLFLINRDGSGLRRPTQTSSIDTEAVFTPDGRQIYFVSDRGGGPQVSPHAVWRRQRRARDLHRQLQHQPGHQPRRPHHGPTSPARAAPSA